MIFTMERIGDFLKLIDLNNIIMSKKKAFYNIPMSFDIETSSFYKWNNSIYSNDDYEKIAGKKNGKKEAIMYIWQFAISGNVIYGRTWKEFIYLCDCLYNYLGLEKRYIVVYVHNLSYEFQFICRRFKWLDIFADSERKPIKATSENHIVFKCSYRLSGYALDTLAKNLRTHTIRKLKGDLDYNLIRNSKTPLSEQELQYCFNDVLIVTAYIEEQILEWGNIENIPLTQTGKVRRFVRERCFQNEKYHFLMQQLTIDKTEYILLKQAFQGGFTHCNAMYTNNVCENVTSFDFTSSYPTVLISEQYPMSKGQKIFCRNEDELKILCRKYSVLANIRLYDVKSIFIFENIISLSKCTHIEDFTVNNGRVVNAKKLEITLTNLDFLNLYDFYSWSKMEIGLVYIYHNSYLPKEIIKTILQLYKDKTELKGVDEKETEYLHSKELLNSIYGMCVTSIVHDSVTFDGDKWTTTQGVLEKELETYNKDRNRFLFYHWGVWCTAYARNNLYTAIKECRSDYIYSDTDSVKILNAEKHEDYFERYNIEIIKKLENCLKWYGLNPDMIRPKTIKGVEKPLGVWDFDGEYIKFKTLGAKRYMVEKSDNDINITVCGLSKKAGRDYIAGQKEPFRFFNNGMYVNKEHTGKMTHTYIDNEIEGIIKDYLGNYAEYHELSYIHLEKTDYLLSLTKMYIDYFMGLQNLYN